MRATQMARRENSSHMGSKTAVRPFASQKMYYKTLDNSESLK